MRRSAVAKNHNQFMVLEEDVNALRLTPDERHIPDSYEDVEREFPPAIFSHLERHLPPHMLNVTGQAKYRFMKNIVDRYLPSREMNRILQLRSYRSTIASHYKHLHEDLFSGNLDGYFAPKFLKAVRENSEAGYRSIMAEPSPGVFTFEIFKPRFCELLLLEVENMKMFVKATSFKVMLPNTMIKKFGISLNDFGLGPMLNKLMDYIRPVASLFFSDVGGGTLDSNHGFVAEYDPPDAHVGFHVDDSEVTLNVCLGDDFSGGNLYFRGIRCERHLDCNSQSEVNVSVLQVPGSAVLHHGRHRHGAQEVTDGYRSNLVLWCRSSSFRELKNYKTDFGSWCEQCKADKRDRILSATAAARMDFILGERPSGA